MKILKIIAKAAISIAAMMALGDSGDLLGTITIFAAIYGLVTWYMFSFANGSPILVGGGLMSMASAMILNLCLPLVAIVVPMFILEAIMPGEIGTVIFGIVIIIACVGSILSDILYILRLFKPDFLGGAPVSVTPDGDGTRDYGDTV